MERDPMEMAMSTDIVMDIVLSHLKVKDLLACRKVSNFKAASSVLRKRSTKIKNISDEIHLIELGECMKWSSDFPFAGLKFIDPWRLSSTVTTKFFRNYGARFTSLYLGISWATRLQDLAQFVNHLPRLSTLEAGYNPGPALLVESLNPIAKQQDGTTLNLPSLQTFRISSDFDDGNEDVLREVCKAASPSLRVECLDATYEILKVLKCVGKLQAVSVMKAGEYGRVEDFAFRVDQLLSTESPALTKLDFDLHSFLSVDGLKKLLISSQHTLKELRLEGICPSQFSPECPVLAKLTTLSLRIVDQSYEYVFQGRQGHKFPALQELKLVSANDEYDPLIGKLSDGLFSVPSLTRIDLVGHFDKDGIQDLARSFPNVIEIRLKNRDLDSGWSWEGDQNYIWSVGAFKYLEKLRIWNYIAKPPNKNMDSFLTGIPIGICENLRRRNQLDSTEPPFHEILRDSPSILQLKNLKELIVCVSLESVLEELAEEPPFISMVSVWYALQMIPNMQAKFVYDCRYPPWRKEDRDKAVTMLKAAFKHVQPHVRLEPLFY